MRIRWFMGLLLLAWAWPALAQFQPATPIVINAPRSLFYDYNARQIIEQPSLRAYDLGIDRDSWPNELTISRDGRLAAWCAYDYGDPNRQPSVSVVVRDLPNNANRLVIDLGEAKMCSLGPGAFSPNAERLAVGSSNFDFALLFEGANPDLSDWRYTVYDLGSAQLLSQALGSQFAIVTDPQLSHMPVTEFWSDDDQLYFYLRPIYFEGGFQGRAAAYQWALRSNTISQPSDASWGEVTADYLPNTGERLWLAEDLTLTQTEASLPYSRSFNVVRLLDRSGFERTVYHIGEGWINTARFSDDGQAILVDVYVPQAPDDFEPPLYRVRIPRGGAPGPLERVATDPNSGIIPSFLWRDSSGVQANGAPAFLTVQGTPYQAVTCPGFMPSRLRLYRNAQVLPGTPNRLRDQPSTSGRQVGEIPGGSIVYVLEGPVCDNQGRAWWRVDYNGTQGWTAEGQGRDYFMDIPR